MPLSPEQVNRIIEIGSTLPAIATGATVAIFAVIKFFDYQKTRVAENSVGSSAVKELKDCMGQLTNRFNIIEEKFRTQESNIRELHSDNQEIKKGNSQIVQSNSDIVKTLLDFVKR